MGKEEDEDENDDDEEEEKQKEKQEDKYVGERRKEIIRVMCLSFSP